VPPATIGVLPLCGQHQTASVTRLKLRAKARCGTAACLQYVSGRLSCSLKEVPCRKLLPDIGDVKQMVPDPTPFTQRYLHAGCCWVN